MKTFFCRVTIVCVMVLTMAPFIDAAEPFIVHTTRQSPNAAQANAFDSKTTKETWPGDKTAVIICDMWDSHTCYGAVQRAQEIAPRINELVIESRRRGATIIHAPSDCMNAYANHPARARAVAEPIVDDLPDEITSWCHQIPSEEAGEYPIDQSDGGNDDTPEEHAAWVAKLTEQGRDLKAPWQKQIDVIRIDADNDFVSDRGDEIWSILQNRGIENVMLMGVHLNMCVLGRPFGLRRLASNGKNVVLVRDLTDTMYNPAMKPNVDHFTGTDLMIRHVERHVCASMTSNDVLKGKPFRFSADDRTGVPSESAP